jgi:hypothetical protein
VPLELERMLSAAFIASPDGRYGTRCSTVVITERVGRRRMTHVFERTFSAGSSVALLRHSRLADWPPRYSEMPAGGTAASEVVEIDDALAPKRTRARGVIQPPAVRVRAR